MVSVAGLTISSLSIISVTSPKMAFIFIMSSMYEKATINGPISPAERITEVMKSSGDMLLFFTKSKPTGKMPKNVAGVNAMLPA